MAVDRRNILGWAASLTAIRANARPASGEPGGVRAADASKDASSLLVQGAGEPVARTLANRAADEINILDFGASADGVGDDFPAFCAARDSRPVDNVVRIRMPARTYRLSRTPDENGRRVVVLVDEGATFEGKFRPFGSRVVIGGASQRNEYLAGRTDENQLVGDSISVHNYGPGSGYGFRFEYISQAVSGGGGDVAQASICQWNNLDHGSAGFGVWNIYATPEESPDARWMVVAAEFNVVNRGADHGWAPRRGVQPTMAGIHSYGPMQESWAGPIGRNILFAQCYFGMPRARTYNIQLVEPDAIAPAGYYAYVQGSSEADHAMWPAAAMAFADSWRDGIRTDQAHIESGAAYSLGPGQCIAYRDERGTIIARDMAGPGIPEGAVAAPPGSTWRRTDPAAGRRFYVKESGHDATGWVAK